MTAGCRWALATDNRCHKIWIAILIYVEQLGYTNRIKWATLIAQIANYLGDFSIYIFCVTGTIIWWMVRDCEKKGLGSGVPGRYCIQISWFRSGVRLSHLRCATPAWQHVHWQSIWQIGRLGIADIRRIYGRHTADIRLICGWHTADMRLTYGRSTAEWRLTYSGCTADIQLIYAWQTADIRRIYGSYTADIRLIYGRHTADIRQVYGRKLKSREHVNTKMVQLLIII